MPPTLSAKALEKAMDSVEARANPWKVSPADRTKLKKKFQSDFEQQITDQASYNFWIGPVERLFNHVGALAARTAEAYFHNVSQDAGEVTWEELFAACHVVRAEICSNRNRQVEYKICSLVFDDNDVARFINAAEPFRKLMRQETKGPKRP